MINMKIFKTCALVSVGLFLASCGSSSVALTSTTTHQGSSSREDRLTQAIHEEVNRYRVSKGLKPLKYHRGLAKLAKPHSDYMKKHAGSFTVYGKKNLVSHYGFEARKTLAEKKYQIESLNENVIASHGLGQGEDLAAKMVRGWLRSENHRHNLNSKWSTTGIAVSFDNDGRAFVTQMFGSSPSRRIKIGTTPLSEW